MNLINPARRLLLAPLLNLKKWRVMRVRRLLIINNVSSKINRSFCIYRSSSHLTLTLFSTSTSQLKRKRRHLVYRLYIILSYKTNCRVNYVVGTSERLWHFQCSRTSNFISCISIFTLANPKSSRRKERSWRLIPGQSLNGR